MEQSIKIGISPMQIVEYIRNYRKALLQDWRLTRRTVPSRLYFANDLGTYQIDCSDSITIDGTGAGWAVLFHDFRVRVLYDSVNNGIYDAKIILITHSAKE